MIYLILWPKHTTVTDMGPHVLGSYLGLLALVSCVGGIYNLYTKYPGDLDEVEQGYLLSALVLCGGLVYLSYVFYSIVMRADVEDKKKKK